ncbi:MAG: flagellar type III secretion system pore protein FliP [Actinomycetota bacterium]|nr:flagellar type III secretion system pore protein FliP [Actinomycetota bacterium]
MKVSILVIALLITVMMGYVSAEPAAPNFPLPKLSFGVESAKSPQDVAVSLQVLLLLTVLTLAPALLIMVTSFTRIVIVLAFIRNALGTQQIPPTQVLIGLALFLTFFVMAPIFAQINDNAIKPYTNNSITYEQAYERASEPIREFMFKQTREKDLALFVHLAKIKRPKTRADVPTYVLIPSFIISELRAAFIIGFLIFIPFLIIDMVVASVLMSMGMLMVPPVMISLPLKILLFVLVDGWHLVTRALVMGFN